MNIFTCGQHMMFLYFLQQGQFRGVCHLLHQNHLRYGLSPLWDHPLPLHLLHFTKVFTMLIILTACHYIDVNSFLNIYSSISGHSSYHLPIRGHHRRHQQGKPPAIAPSPSKNQGDIYLPDKICVLKSLCVCMCVHAHMYYVPKATTEKSTME